MVAVWGALFVELVVVSVLRRRELESGWEIRMGALWLAPSAFVAALPAGGLAAGLYWAFIRRSRGARAGVAAVAGVGVSLTTYLVTTGRHFEAVGLRVLVTIGTTLLAFGVAWGVYPRAAAALRRTPRASGLSLAFAAIGLEVANQLVLVRLYPAFHVALAVVTLVAAGCSALAMSGGAPPGSAKQGAACAAFVVVLSLFAAKPAAKRLSRFDNFRLVLVEHAPLLGHAVTAAALLVPPPPIGPADPCLVDPLRCNTNAARGAVDFTGRDLVLITIDALRADHLGAYGYARPTTPHIDALARSGAVFEDAYCPTPHTSYSITSLMTGKYMRPLLLQGAGADSETFASFLRTYGYKTAGFYPPAVFFIDQSRFAAFERSHFGFEYRKVEFLEGKPRADQVAAYLEGQPPSQRVFLWVHLFGPHEPYEAHAAHPFGERDVDRYDSEIAEADDTVGAIVAEVRKERPKAVVIVTADHGEEFGDHGGHYHGTSVYEEQVRVPLVISAPGVVAPRRVREVVQTIDLLPTVLSALAIPVSPRIRGRNLGPLLSGSAEHEGLAFAETDEDTLLAEGSFRLVCARKIGACRLFDLEHDPTEQTDASARNSARFERMRADVIALGASHGRFEREGLRAESGRGWPAPILRGIAGDADAALDIASLLDDSDREIRQKAAELLAKLKRPETVPALRLALSRDEDELVKRWCSLALTRLGEAAPLVTDLLRDPDPSWRRRASLALAENGDPRGEAVLIDWWQHGGHDDYDRALEILGAFARLRSKDAVFPLLKTLRDVRLRTHIASTLATIGDPSARGPLVAALADERYQTARVALTTAAIALGAKEELARPLIRLLGVPDPLANGIGDAERAKILDLIGGPDEKGLARLREQSNLGVKLVLTVPKGGNGEGVRAIVRARALGHPGEVRIGRPTLGSQYSVNNSRVSFRKVPTIQEGNSVSLRIPDSQPAAEVAITLPKALGARPGRAVELVVFAERNVHLDALALVPLSDELPPPAPLPWKPSQADDTP